MSGFQLGGVQFRQVENERTRVRSAEGEFALMKSDRVLRFYEALRPHLPKTIMELGIFEGGSLVYFDKLFKPTRLIGVDRRPCPVPALEAYCNNKPHIATYYARFQDKLGVLQAARQNFPKGVDLVVDDASHLYEPTKATFAMLFPLVRTGGHYVIERWRQAPATHKALDGPPLARFVHELVALSSLTPVIESVDVGYDLICVRKGSGVYDAQTLDPVAAMRRHGVEA